MALLLSQSWLCCIGAFLLVLLLPSACCIVQHPSVTNGCVCIVPHYPSLVVPYTSQHLHLLLRLATLVRYLQGAAHYVTADKQHDDDGLAPKQQQHSAPSTPQSAAADAHSSSSQPGTHLVSPQGLAVQIICSCDKIPDEGVEVLVLRGLLTATTSLTFTLHGQALLLAVRTCYNIHLMSRSEVNQTTAKATLTQMLNVVFQRMEAGSVKIAVSTGSRSRGVEVHDGCNAATAGARGVNTCRVKGLNPAWLWFTAKRVALSAGSSVLPVSPVIVLLLSVPCVLSCHGRSRS